MTETEIEWGPAGETVFERTYSRTKPNGEKETWQETVGRVAKGNLALVHGDDVMSWPQSARDELRDLVQHIEAFKILPAGRHLWASGVKGRQYLMNCWTSGWGEKLSEHFEFTFMRLMEGGGVGANYSSHFLAPYGAPRRELDVHIVCDPGHPDYAELSGAGVLSSEYDADWAGSFEVEDSREGWASALVDLIDTFMDDGVVQHRARVFDVSRVRGRGSRLKTFGGTASGPTPFAVMMHEVGRVMNSAHNHYVEHYSMDVSKGFHGGQLSPLAAMEIDHAIAECVVSGGNRRSARMSMVRWDDPYIFDFITCKQDTGKHWTTNISVEVDDYFLDCINGVDSIRIQSDDIEHAREVHRAVIEAVLTNGEPGYWNSSLSNKGELEPVYATNPCGEITLQQWEACNLGHVNLDKFAPKSSGAGWDEGGLIDAHRLVTRFLIRATYADINDPKSRKVQDANRRIGVGHLGVQDFIVKNGWRYSDVAVKDTGPGYHAMRSLLERLYRAVRNTARSYAFELRIPEPVKVTTVAPTGSISKLPGVGGEGIHPIYARHYEQRIRFSMRDEDQVQQVSSYMAQGFRVELDQYDKSGSTEIVVFPTKNRLVQQVEDMGYPGTNVESADELPLGTLLAFQAMYQKHYADNAVSFTANVPEGLDPQQVAGTVAYWLPKLKGTTIMVDGTRPQAPFTRITAAEYESAALAMVGDGVDEDCANGACPVR